MRGRAFRHIAPGLTIYNLQVFEPTADDVNALLDAGWMPHEADAQADLRHTVLFFTTDASVAAQVVSPGEWEWETTEAFPLGPPVEVIDTDTGETWDLTAEKGVQAYNASHPDSPVDQPSDGAA